MNHRTETQNSMPPSTVDQNSALYGGSKTAQAAERQSKKKTGSAAPSRQRLPVLVLAMFFLAVFIASIFLLIPGLRTNPRSAPQQQQSETLFLWPQDTSPNDHPTSTGEWGMLNFKADLRELEFYMNPSDRNAYLVYVSIDNPLDASYVPNDLTEVLDTRSDRSYRLMRLYAEKSLEAFLMESRAQGFTEMKKLTVTSAYRSYQDQSKLFNDNLAAEMRKDPTLTEEQAKAKVLAYSLPAGCSESQLGLTVDLDTAALSGGSDNSFGESEVGRWLAENCWKFGFILRYSQDKENVTGVTWQPRHFRYVGRYHAYKMHTMNMCLEEYLLYLGIPY